MTKDEEMSVVRFWIFNTVPLKNRSVCVHRSTTTIEVCYRQDSFIFAMENLWLDLYGNINHFAKTNFFSHTLHGKDRHSIMYLTHKSTELVYISLIRRLLGCLFQKVTILVIVMCFMLCDDF